MSPHPQRGNVATLVRTARGGDQAAWDALVRRFAPVVRAVVRRHRLSASDGDDIGQRTWLALLEHLPRIEQPEALGGWLATTARNECLRLCRERCREIVVADPVVPGTSEAASAAGHGELTAVLRHAALRGALAAMSGRQRALIDLLLHEPPLSYEEVSRRLDIPVGSIGPTRARCVERLRRDPGIADLLDGTLDRKRPTRPLRRADPRIR